MTRPPDSRFPLADLAQALQAARRILLMTHLNPDGDALGSLLALAEGLERLGKTVTRHHEGPAPAMYGFLPGLDRVAPTLGPVDEYDRVLLLDCHELDRVGPQAAALNPGARLMVLDHHLTRNHLPDLALVDPSASSTGELVFELLNRLGVDLTESIAVNLYVAIATDTGMFAFDNTSKYALQVASRLVAAGARPWDVFSRLYMERSPAWARLLGLALARMEYHFGGWMGLMMVTADMLAESGALMEDTDGFVEYPRRVAGVELAALFREHGDGSVKVSLRSRGGFNAAAVAQLFGGGGHFQAAGFSLSGSLADVKARVLDEIGRQRPMADPVS
jgi:phosphoesterase RecJ-like protein